MQIGESDLQNTVFYLHCNLFAQICFVSASWKQIIFIKSVGQNAGTTFTIYHPWIYWSLFAVYILITKWKQIKKGSFPFSFHLKMNLILSYHKNANFIKVPPTMTHSELEKYIKPNLYSTVNFTNSLQINVAYFVGKNQAFKPKKHMVVFIFAHPPSDMRHLTFPFFS